MDLPPQPGLNESTLFIYQKKTERLRVAQSFLIEGFEAGQRVVAVVDAATAALFETIAEYVGIKRGGNEYTFVTPEDLLVSPGFNTDALRTRLQELVATYAREEPRGVRILLDMHFVSLSVGSGSELERFARQLSDLTRGYPITLVSLFFFEYLPRGGLQTFLNQYDHIRVSESLMASCFPVSGDGNSDSSLNLDLVIERLAFSDERTIRYALETRGRAGTAKGGRLPGRPRFLQFLQDIVLILDPHHRIRYISPAIVRYAGRNASELQGRSLAELCGIDSARSLEEDLAAVTAEGGQGGDPGLPTSLTIPVVTRDGVRVQFEATVSQILVHGVLHGYLCLLRRLGGARLERNRGGPTVEVRTEKQFQGGNGAPSAAAGDGKTNGNPYSQLTAREFEIIQHLLEGLSNRDIGLRLYIAEVTVKKHLTNIYRKLGVRNKFELMKIVR